MMMTSPAMKSNAIKAANLSHYRPESKVMSLIVKKDAALKKRSGDNAIQSERSEKNTTNKRASIE